MLERTQELFKEYKQTAELLHKKAMELKAQVELETSGSLSVIVDDISPIHIYAGFGVHFDQVEAIADEHTVTENYVYKDGSKNYTFTVCGAECIAIKDGGVQ